MTPALTVTDASFKSVVDSHNMVLIDFWAPWCRPCLELEPLINTVAEEYLGKVVVGKVDVNEYMERAKQYKIKHIPALLLFIDGKLQESHAGILTYEELHAILDRYCTA